MYVAKLIVVCILYDYDIIIIEFHHSADCKIG